MPGPSPASGTPLHVRTSERRDASRGASAAASGWQGDQREGDRGRDRVDAQREETRAVEVLSLLRADLPVDARTTGVEWHAKAVQGGPLPALPRCLRDVVSVASQVCGGARENCAGAT